MRFDLINKIIRIMSGRSKLKGRKNGSLPSRETWFRVDGSGERVVSGLGQLH